MNRNHHQAMQYNKLLGALLKSIYGSWLLRSIRAPQSAQIIGTMRKGRHS
jgi:hypothetical protein